MNSGFSRHIWDLYVVEAFHNLPKILLVVNKLGKQISWITNHSDMAYIISELVNYNYN